MKIHTRRFSVMLVVQKGFLDETNLKIFKDLGNGEYLKTWLVMGNDYCSKLN